MIKKAEEDVQPGSRSGEGVQSLWTHLVSDASRKASAAGAFGAGGAAAGEQPDGGPRAEIGSRRRYTLLIVDDVDAARYAVARSLRHDGFFTQEAANAETALKQAEFVDAVVLDVHLPDLSGLEVCRMLRARPKTASLPVILLSSIFVDQADQARGLAAGADAYFVPPVDPPALAATLDALLLRRQRHRSAALGTGGGGGGGAAPAP
jgi:CheY-like chemotaxis protein